MTDNALSGQARIPSGNSEYNELDFVVRQIVAGMATSQPVTVRAVGVGTVDVQPMVAQIDGDGNATLHGVIHNLPVVRLQGGGNAFIVDPVVGDIGLAVFASHDISSVKANRAPSNPGSRRRFDWADGVYVGGLLNGLPAQFVRVAGDGVYVESPMVTVAHSLVVTDAATGVFVSQDGKVVTVVAGVVVSIV